MDIKLDVLKAKKEELQKELEQLQVKAHMLSGAMQIVSHLIELAGKPVIKAEDLSKEEQQKLSDALGSK